MSRFTDAVSVLMGAKALPEGAPSPDLYGIASIPGRRVSNRTAEKHTQTYGGTDAIDAVFECVQLYASTTANAEHYFKNADGTILVPNPRSPEYRNRGYSTAPADLTELFDHPNRTMEYSELMELSVIDLLLAGEFIWLKNQINALGQPKEVYRVPPALIEVVPGRVGPKQYIYNRPGAEPLTYRPDEVVHVKLPNPHDPWRGLGVVRANPRLFDIALAVDDAIAQYYEQGTRLSGVLESERSIPDTTWQKIKRQFFNLYSGGSNQFRVAALERGLKFRPISSTAQQADFATAQDKAGERVFGVFFVPRSILTSQAGADRQAVKEDQRNFDNRVMRPFLDALQSRITHQLLHPAGEWTDIDFCIEYEYTVPFEDRVALAEKMEGMPVRVWELRRQIGLDPLGDERDDILLVDPAQATPPPKGTQPSAPTTPGDTPGLQRVGTSASYPAGAMGRTGESDARKSVLGLLAEAEEKLNGYART